MHTQLKQMRRLAGVATVTGASLFCHAALAQDAKAKEAPQAPPLASQIDDKDIAADLIKPAANLLSGEQRKMVERSGREIRYFLPIQMTSGFIYNPSTGEYDQVSLRSYGRNVSGAPNLLRPDFVAPTVVMKPGQTVRFDLSNRLDKEPGCELVAKDNINTPHCYNTTNLHSHGLWISPSGNSDNVLLAIKPKVNFEYEYNVPADHPAGTFWYHPHVHGSTAVQVGSGMAGALIVKGDRQPTVLSNGDLDTLLNPFKPASGNYSEVMLMQQIPYACFIKGPDPKEPGKEIDVIQTNPDGTWLCKKGDIGVVQDFKAQFAPGSWNKSGRHTLINGFARNPAKPLMMEAGKLYRWRLIDAGVRESIVLRIRKINDVSKLTPTAATPEALQAEVKNACNGIDVLQFEVATDGLTRPSAFAKVTNTLQPGYRSDILFSLPEKGDYCVYSDSGAPDFISALPNNAKVITVIHATGNKTSGDQTQFVTKELVRAAGLLSKSVRDTIIRDLKDGLKLTKFVPHKAIPESELTDPQKPVDLVLGIDQRNGKTIFDVNGAPYVPSEVHQTLILGQVQEWHIKSYNPTDTGEAPIQHPFHIHVNPYQIISITDKNGVDVSALTDTTAKTIGQYAGLQGVWKDTIMATPGYTVKTRTRYQRYIGEYVLHCHILDHEDQGMMQNVKVVLPDGNGGASVGGHGAHGSH
ncbi:multicopper oxidase family protein [Undibacterium sp. Ji42W]|uniref:multicopper oxidase family protein n=1 Tax=Undibacterium sp. Ji42W TaxID=3413039 RepID=UPI003BF21BE1